MDKVRLTLSNSTAYQVVSFLMRVAQSNSPARLRLVGQRPDRHLVKVVTICCARLCLRIQRACLVERSTYKLTVPAEEALSLLTAWSTCKDKELLRTHPGVQHIVGLIDQALA